MHNSVWTKYVNPSCTSDGSFYMYIFGLQTTMLVSVTLSTVVSWHPFLFRGEESIFWVDVLLLLSTGFSFMDRATFHLQPIWPRRVSKVWRKSYFLRGCKLQCSSQCLREGFLLGFGLSICCGRLWRIWLILNLLALACVQGGCNCALAIYKTGLELTMSSGWSMHPTKSSCLGGT